MFSGWQKNLFSLPFNIGRSDRLLFSVLPGSSHPVCHSLCQDWTHCRRSIVVLSRGYITGGAVEMDMKDTGLLFSLCTGQTNEFRRHVSITVIALRMRGVVAHHRQSCLVIPEAEYFQVGINDTFRGGNCFRVLTLAVAHELYFAVRTEEPPI